LAYAGDGLHSLAGRCYPSSSVINDHEVWRFKNLKEAVRLFLEEAERMGTLEQILEEAGYSRGKHKFAPKYVGIQRMTLPLPLTHAKTQPGLL